MYLYKDQVKILLININIDVKTSNCTVIVWKTDYIHELVKHLYVNNIIFK